MGKEIEENKIQSESGQDAKNPFWRKPKIPLYFAVIFVLFTITVTSVLYLSLKQEDKKDISPFKDPSTRPLTLNYSGANRILLGETIELSWQYEGLDYYSDEILLCLVGYDSSSQEISAKEPWNEELCTYPSGSVAGSYLIARADLEEGSYKWTVPNTIQASYVETPDAYSIRALVFDNRTEETHEWAGVVGKDETEKTISFTANKSD